MAISGYIAKLKRGLGLAFGKSFLHDFSMNMLLIQYSINGKSFKGTPYLLLKTSHKMCY